MANVIEVETGEGEKVTLNFMGRRFGVSSVACWR